MHSPKEINKTKNSYTSIVNSHIPKKYVSTSFDAATAINDAKNISHEIPSKINTPTEFIRQRNKLAIQNSFENWTKNFLEQKSKALIEIKLDDEILEENNSNILEYKANNSKHKINNSSKKRTEYIINSKSNLKSDINCYSKINQDGNTIYRNDLDSKNKIDMDKKLKKEIKKEKKNKNHKNQVIIKKSSTTNIKLYDDNIKKWEGAFNFSQKRKNLMRIDDDIEESSISNENKKNKNNIKLLEKDYKKIFNETVKEIINNSKIDSIRIILEEMI